MDNEQLTQSDGKTGEDEEMEDGQESSGEYIDFLNYGSDEEPPPETEEFFERDLMDVPILVNREDRAYMQPFEEDEDYIKSDCTPISNPIPEGNEFYPRNKFDFSWGRFSEYKTLPKMRRESFPDVACGPTAQTPYESPYSAFIDIWTEQIMEHIVNETNKYAQQLKRAMLKAGKMSPTSLITNWRDTDVDELYTYFALVMGAGFLCRPVKLLWSEGIFAVPWLSKCMSYDRFILLNRCLHFQDNDVCGPESMTLAEARLFKVQPIVAHLNNRFQELYNIGRNVTLDESLTRWKIWSDTERIDELYLDQTFPVSIKSYEICDSKTGYLWRFEVHADDSPTSQENDPISRKIPSIVLKLLHGLEQKGHTVWLDSFYTSPALARELKIRGFDCVGPVHVERQFIPTELADIDDDDDETIAKHKLYARTSGDVDVIAWRDVGLRVSISTYHGRKAVVVNGTKEPAVFVDYKFSTNKLDRKDEWLKSYPFEQKRTNTWYKKFFKRLLNASIINAHVLFNQSSTSHSSFRHKLISSILSRHAGADPATSSIGTDSSDSSDSSTDY